MAGRKAQLDPAENINRSFLHDMVTLRYNQQISIAITITRYYEYVIVIRVADKH
jgi:hypothetical protein